MAWLSFVFMGAKAGLLCVFCVFSRRSFVVDSFVVRAGLALGIFWEEGVDMAGQCLEFLGQDVVAGSLAKED
jgi:hypothetical protein